MANNTNTIFAFCALLQKELKAIVESCFFRNRGEGRVVTEPCSLVTIEPFVPGGLRRLVLNAHSPLILAIAERCLSAKPSSKTRNDIIRLVSTMITTGSWPIELFDLSISMNLQWSAAFGLICGPHSTCIWPVPHIISNSSSMINNDDDEEEEFDSLSVYPLRICGTKGKLSRRDSASVDKIEVTYARDRWAKRDAIIHTEWQRISSSSSSFESSSMIGSLVRRLSGSCVAIEDKIGGYNGSSDKIRRALVAYGPSLPVFALADVLSNKGVPLLSCVPSAAAKLLKTDRLFGLSLFFGVPLLDRTNTLKGCMQTVPLVPPPTQREVEEYRVKIGLSPKPLLEATVARTKEQEQQVAEKYNVGLVLTVNKQKSSKMKDINNSEVDEEEEEDEWWSSQGFELRSGILKLCHAEMNRACLAAAEALWEESEKQQGSFKCLRVMWSGGIDSTGALVALLFTAGVGSNLKLDTLKEEEDPSCRFKRLIVVLDEESMSEYPWFYQNIIINLNVNVLPRDAMSVSEVASRYPLDLIVTGELGDQTFGSDRCKNCFGSDPIPDSAMDSATSLPLSSVSIRKSGNQGGGVGVGVGGNRDMEIGQSDTNTNQDEEGVPIPRRLLGQLKDMVKEAREGAAPSNECFQAGLAASWERTVLRSLSLAGLTAGTEDQWKQWIQPQLTKAPFPILNTHDLLWWLNFSCKWQQVSLRCTHDGGPEFNLKAFPRNNIKIQKTNSLNSEGVNDHKFSDDNDGNDENGNDGRSNCVSGMNIRHFFERKDMELWSCVYEFHKLKFGNLAQWTTYKEPLKAFILWFTRDGNYYRNKEKVASLNHGIPDVYKSFDIETLLGLSTILTTEEVQDDDVIQKKKTMFNTDFSVQKNSQISRLSCLNLKLGYYEKGKQINHLFNDQNEIRLCDYVRKEFLFDNDDQEENTQVINVNPWIHRTISSFQNALYFATTDERQQRSFNPVTVTTLDAKCHAMLPTQLVSGKTVLDLGACLGALCHHALMVGATRVVAVEVQPDFCERAVEMLTRASSLWLPLFKPAASSSASSTATEAVEEVDPQERFEVVCSGIREFLAKTIDNAFDVVIAAGVLHCFEDPSVIMREMSRVCRHSIVIEADHVEVVSNGTLHESSTLTSMDKIQHRSSTSATLAQSTSAAPHVSGNISLLQLAPQSLVNKSGKLEGTEGEGGYGSYVGLAVVPSRVFVEDLLKALGYHVMRVTLAPHPTLNDDIAVYTTAKKFNKLPRRYFLRATYKHPYSSSPSSSLSSPNDSILHPTSQDTSPLIMSLESTVVSGHGALHSWNSVPKWWEYSSTQPNDPIDQDADPSCFTSKYALPASAVATATAAVEGAWSFEDQEVASRFDREAMCHIPDYVCVIEAGIDAIEKALSEYAKLVNKNLNHQEIILWARSQRVVDIGSATGTTMVYLLKKSFLDVHGVEASDPMILASQNKLKATFGWELEKTEKFLHKAIGEHYLLPTDSLLTLIPSEYQHELQLQQQVQEEDKNKLIGVGAIICNWTLHFIPEATRRFNYLKSLYEGLQPGGILILTDKTEQGPRTRDSYHQWKSQPPRSVSLKEVEAKAARLVGVLVTFNTNWYETSLAKIGFVNVSILWSRFGFVTWFASKPIAIS